MNYWLMTDGAWFQSTHPRGVRPETDADADSFILFQSTHPRGVRRVSKSCPAGVVVFQSTHPRGVRRVDIAVGRIFSPVSIHAPTRGATMVSAWARGLLPRFNPRTHAGCDNGFGLGARALAPFQSTHPRGVRPPPNQRRLFLTEVSIHAPTRGATTSTFGLPLLLMVSIHAPTRGATLCRRNCGFIQYVSIHAPTRGATTHSCPSSDNAICFNPRTHAGCDNRLPKWSGRIFSFQSTHPRGVRPARLLCFFFGLSFNPRTHAGCDRRYQSSRHRTLVFQSTHPRGVRRSHGMERPAVDRFNPRTHAGCDVSPVGAGNAVTGFNPRTHAGCDRPNPTTAPMSAGFQSTHPRGVRPDGSH